MLREYVTKVDGLGKVIPYVKCKTIEGRSFGIENVEIQGIKNVLYALSGIGVIKYALINYGENVF